MNIGERYFCSKCMREVDEYGLCPYCGYDPASPIDEVCLEEGTLFQNGRYELGAVIGKGGFGITYAAWDMVLDIPVAIKEYLPTDYCRRNTAESDDVEINNNFFYIGLQTFIREARVLATLQNVSTVVQVYDCFEKNNTAYIIMEYVRGKTLLSYYGGKKVKSKELLALLRPVFDDLILVHKAGVLHRDISPNNILIQENGIPKLIDFGAAMSLTDHSLQNSSLNLSFAAPEQYKTDGRQGFWTDVYGLSATIYSIMTGKIIQDAQSRLAADQVKKPLRFDKLSKRIFRGVFRGLKLDDQKRTQSVEELRADIYHLPKPIITKQQKIKHAVKIILFSFLVEFGAYGAIVAVDEKWFDQACDAIQCYTQEDTSYAIQLAENYRQGSSGEFGYRRNIEKCLYWYKWAADHGNQEAMFQYALILQEGKITEQNMPKAIEYYEKAAGEAAPMAWNNLGVIYLWGNGVEKDSEKAFQCFKEAEKYDVALAFTNLGTLYEAGQVVEKDVDQAVDYYEIAAEMGEAEGMYRLALCYNQGIGVEQSDVECLRLLYESAALDCPEAMYTIGNLYETGDMGLEKNYDLALTWYLKAGALDDDDAYYYEAQCYEEGEGDDIDQSDKSDSESE